MMPTAHRLRRRIAFSFALAPLAGLLPTTVRAQGAGLSSEEIVLGHSGDLTGPLRDLGTEVLKGAQLYFDALNARGGVHGRKVKLVAKDDAYEPEKTLMNVNAYVENDDVFALFGVFGTPNNEATIPVALKAGVPMVGPYTGATSIRKRELRGLFNIRASYADETEKLVEHLSTLNIRRLAIAHQDNAFGREVLAGAQLAMAKLGLKPVIVVSVKNDASDAAEAVAKIAALEETPQALLLGLAGKPTIETIRHLNQKRRGIALYAPSVLASPSNLRSLGKDATGITVTQIVPLPRDATLQIVREYQATAVAAGEKEFTHLALEGFINAKVTAEGLRRAGRNLTRPGFISAMESIRKYDVGGMEINFGQGAASGSRLVELTMINAQGRLIR
jgi:branched-chain amino acid transport system substrate-binding protein